MTETEKREQEQKIEMKSAARELLFALLRYETCGVAIPENFKERLSNPDLLKALYEASKAHDLAHLIADALFKNKLLDKATPAGKAFLKQLQTAVFRYEQIAYELKSVCEVLEEKKIAHMPLKGSVLRALYPQPWMRTSCDIDIYVQESDLEDAANAIVEKLDYQNDGKGSHDMQMFAPSGVHLELHYDLIEDSVSPEFKKKLSKIWENAVPVRENGYTYKMTDEDFYFYHIAHTAKHFKNGGCGIRPFIDLWYLEKSLPYDREKTNELLTECGLFKFAEAARKLVRVWFEAEEHNELSKETAAFVLSGGTYGALENRVAVQTSKGRFAYFLYRVFPPYRELKNQYLILRKWPILYPFYIVRRWFNLLFVKGRAKNSLREWNVAMDKSRDKAEEKRVKNLLKNLDLDEKTIN